jgi:hypothetical protein
MPDKRNNDLDANRPRGRPRRRWIDSVNEIWNAVGQEVRTNWRIIAQDREKWEEIVLTVKILNGL